MSYNVALVGAGNIGLLYDDDKSKRSALSHAKGIYLHKKFTLKYLVDTNQQVFSKAQNLFPNVECFTDWRKLVNNRDIDVLVIALPTELHFNCLKDFEKNQNIKIFFIEKQLFTTQSEYDDIDERIKKKIVVNYIRRFEPAITSLREKIKKGIYKNPLKIICKYTKGFRHNASHAVDLLNYMFNNPPLVKIKVLDKIIDYRDNDPTLDVFVKIKYKSLTVPVYFIGANEKKYSIFEADVLFENKRIELTDFGKIIKSYDVISDPEYPGYRILGRDAEIVNTNMRFVMWNAYNVLENIINRSIKNISSFRDEIYNFNFICSILNEINNV